MQTKKSCQNSWQDGRWGVGSHWFLAWSRRMKKCFPLTGKKETFFIPCVRDKLKMFEFSVQWKEGKTEEADQYFLSINHGPAIYLVTYNIMLFNPYRSPVGCAILYPFYWEGKSGKERCSKVILLINGRSGLQTQGGPAPVSKFPSLCREMNRMVSLPFLLSQYSADRWTCG